MNDVVNMQDEGLTANEIYDKHYAAAEREGYIAQKEQEIAQAKLDIELGEAFKRLESNEDFKLVIEEAYIETTRNRITKALGTNLKPEIREDCHNMLMGVGGLQVFLEGIMQTAFKANTELPAFQDDLANVQNEAL